MKAVYKTEPHLHVCEVSRCSHLTAKEMMERYADAGYSTVFVSDHLTRSYFERLGDIPLAEKVDGFLGGYAAAKPIGEALGMTVLLAVELCLDAYPNHYLLYGIDRDFLLREDLFSLSLEALFDYAHSRGVTVIQAHPYRDGKTAPHEAFIDAIEAHNPNPRHENYTERALAFAREHGFPVTGGSDAHRPEDVACGGVITEQKIRTTADYVDAVLSGNLRLIGWEDGK